MPNINTPPRYPTTLQDTTPKATNKSVVYNLVITAPKARHKVSRPHQTQVAEKISKEFHKHAEEVKRLVWETFVVVLRRRGDFTALYDLLHLSRGTLRKYKHRGRAVALTEGE